MKLYLTGLDGMDSVQADDVGSNFENNAVVFRAANVKGRNYVFSIKELAYKSTGGKSYHKVKKGSSAIGFVVKWHFKMFC